MSTKNRMKHFWGAICIAIKSSLPVLVVAIFLAIMLLFLFLFSPVYNDNFLAFFIGIIASIIASVVFDVSSKYSRSCSVYLWILDQVEVLITYVEAFQHNLVTNDLYRFELWRNVVTIRNKARDLAHTDAFTSISTKLSLLIKAANEQDEGNLHAALLDLIDARNKITKE